MKFIFSTCLIMICLSNFAFAEGLSFLKDKPGDGKVVALFCTDEGCERFEMDFGRTDLDFVSDSENKQIQIKSAAKLENGKLYDDKGVEITIDISDLSSSDSKISYLATSTVVNGETKYYFTFDEISSDHKSISIYDSPRRGYDVFPKDPVYISAPADQDATGTHTI